MGWLFLCLVMVLSSLCSSQNSLVPGTSISGNQTLTSSGGTFALGFVSPENSKKFFLGIWYKAIGKTPIVWVANREKPLDSPGVLKLGDDGNLVVFDGMTGKEVTWSSNASVPASAVNATTVVLMDSGNLKLVFREDILWQSFEHPSDTLLPGMRLSANRRTGQKTVLITSWATLDDPQPGKFTVGTDPKVPGQLVTWKENAPYWRSAVYFGQEAKTFFRNNSGGFIYLAYNFDDNDIYYTFGVSDNAIRLRVVLSPTGLCNLLLWQENTSTWSELWGEPINKCDFYARCGPYGACDKNGNPLSSQCKCLKGFRTEFQKQYAMGDWPGGCVREKALTCDKREGFSKFEKMKLPDHAILLGNMSTSECEFECLKNCSCTAYAYANTTEGNNVTCYTWFGELMDLVENHGVPAQNFYIRVHLSDQGGKGHANKRSLVIPIVSATAGLLTIVFGYFLWKKTLSNQGSIRGRTSEIVSTFGARNGKSDTELPLFSLRSILAATNNFSEANKLGEGGFGPVYKGILIENQEVAIKRLSKKSGQGQQEFMNELKLISKLQHTNLVRLLGCCIEEDEKILIYEYMPNRSLDKFLFDPSEKTKLDWGKRFRIVEGIAQGVLYIHKYSRLKIIHRDLKASNVLLDGTLNPKISDFGMARIFGINQIEANTNRVVGTYGYMSPEYALHGHISEKLDVFSFGVLLLEIVSGKKNADFYRSEHFVTVSGWAWELWKEGRGMEVIDESVRETCSGLDEAVKCIHVGLLCVQEAPADRPTMSSVVVMLSNEATSLPPTKEPAFSTRRNSSTVGSSHNVLTMSMPEAR